MRAGGENMRNFGEIFKLFRESRGLRLKDIAKAGISISQLSRFEKASQGEFSRGHLSESAGKESNQKF